MYSVNKDLSTVTKTHILQTNFNGSNGLAIHAIDDILAIHDRYVNKNVDFFFSEKIEMKIRNKLIFL